MLEDQARDPMGSQLWSFRPAPFCPILPSSAGRRHGTPLGRCDTGLTGRADGAHCDICDIGVFLSPPQQ